MRNLHYHLYLQDFLVIFTAPTPSPLSEIMRERRDQEKTGFRSSRMYLEGQLVSHLISSPGSMWAGKEGDQYAPEIRWVSGLGQKFQNSFSTSPKKSRGANWVIAHYSLSSFPSSNTLSFIEKQHILFMNVWYHMFMQNIPKPNLTFFH